MASKDKTSKTARVMNLLSKKPDPSAVEAPVEVAPEKSAAPVPPIVTSMAPDAAVSVQIKNALEDALEGELGPQRTGAPVQQSVTQVEPPASEPDLLRVEDFVTMSAPEVTPDETGKEEDEFVELEVPAAAEAPAQSERQFLEPVNPGYINVMQVLVEEKAPKYVEMFGLCTCKRCMEDVKAYTLNHLPPKYVVLEPGDRVPRLTVYEGKFSSDITAQLLQACKAVHETPHHSRG